MFLVWRLGGGVQRILGGKEINGGCVVRNWDKSNSSFFLWLAEMVIKVEKLNIEWSSLLSPMRMMDIGFWIHDVVVGWSG